MRLVTARSPRRSRPRPRSITPRTITSSTSRRTRWAIADSAEPVSAARSALRAANSATLSIDAPDETELDPYVDFTREEWSRLRASTPLSLAEHDLAALRGLNEPMPMLEVEEV